jgi:hypothetical protein
MGVLEQRKLVVRVTGGFKRLSYEIVCPAEYEIIIARIGCIYDDAHKEDSNERTDRSR